MGFSEEEIQAQARELQMLLESASEEDSGEQFPEDFEEEATYPEFKKYVVRVNSEYIEMIEQLSYEERNLFMNELLEDYIQRDIEREKSEVVSSKLKILIYALIFIIIGLPIMIWMFNISLDATHSNYKDMQDKFIKLYQSSEKY